MPSKIDLFGIILVKVNITCCPIRYNRYPMVVKNHFSKFSTIYRKEKKCSKQFNKEKTIFIIINSIAIIDKLVEHTQHQGLVTHHIDWERNVSIGYKVLLVNKKKK